MIPNLQQTCVILVFCKGLYWAHCYFNLYVNNLQDIDPADSVNTCHTIKTLQNLTNSTIYPKHSKASEQSKRFVMKQ